MGAHSIGSEERAVVAAETQSLYERLGGVYAIAVVVDDFIDRIMVDPRLNANARVDEAHHRVSAQGFKYYVTEQVCWAAGGPQTYSGRTMLDAHRELLISGAEWDAFMDDFHQTLAKFGVPERERGELDAIVESTKDDIVTTSAAPAASQYSRRVGPGRVAGHSTIRRMEIPHGANGRVGNGGHHAIRAGTIA
jgi:hemoglobin